MAGTGGEGDYAMSRNQSVSWSTDDRCQTLLAAVVTCTEYYRDSN